MVYPPLISTKLSIHQIIHPQKVNNLLGDTYPFLCQYICRFSLFYCSSIYLMIMVLCWLSSHRFCGSYDQLAQFACLLCTFLVIKVCILFSDNGKIYADIYSGIPVLQFTMLTRSTTPAASLLKGQCLCWQRTPPRSQLQESLIRFPNLYSIIIFFDNCLLQCC